jgi:hypothetical protein
MLCPHCGHENVDGRKYCRACAKPLVAELVPAKPPLPAPSNPATLPPSTAATNMMAVASLALSLLAFIVPLGIASVVMGHISRGQIARSNGRQTGSWFAFAGLVLSYLQLTVVGILFVVLGSVALNIKHHLDHDRYVRGALVERLVAGDPRHPSAAMADEYRRNAVDSLRLIRARQDSYRDSRPGGYACTLLDLTNDDAEIKLHVIQSHYVLQVVCQPDPQTGVVHGYSVSAIPRSDNNPADAPAYCLDSTGTIRKYGIEAAQALISKTFMSREPCPDDGEPID